MRTDGTGEKIWPKTKKKKRKRKKKKRKRKNRRKEENEARVNASELGTWAAGS